MIARDSKTECTSLMTFDRQQDVIRRFESQGVTLTVSEPFPAIAMPTHNGLDGLVCKIDSEKMSALVKTYHHDVLTPYHFDNAVESYRRAGEIGIGAKLVLEDVATQSLFISCLDETWHTAKVTDFSDKSRLEEWINVTRQWHKEGSTQLECSAFDVFNHYVTLWKAQANPIPFPTNAGITLNKLIDWMALIEKAIVASGYNKVVLHGENVVSNVMFNAQGKVKLVDFDRTTAADPFWDLAAMSLETCSDDNARNALLEMYFGSRTESELARLKLYTLVDDAVWSLWALLGELNPYRKGPELYKYAANRLIRLRHHFTTFDIPAMLKEV